MSKSDIVLVRMAMMGQQTLDQPAEMHNVLCRCSDLILKEHHFHLDGLQFILRRHAESYFFLRAWAQVQVTSLGICNGVCFSRLAHRWYFHSGACTSVTVRWWCVIAVVAIAIYFIWLSIMWMDTNQQVRNGWSWAAKWRMPLMMLPPSWKRRWRLHDEPGRRSTNVDELQWRKTLRTSIWGPLGRIS